ncbi:uncharacterized protein LOC128959722 [Oppia nitens]|uniref:uncharacterized protein LOC128959722 n=1 Tax=Oppia nitens TaxID=1686743 RepID=UPI0023DC7E92|nr:uncharacterized protein LOC128959722 [Oppia nitens]
MAVFLINQCKFNSCGITFPTLTELIRHIEDTHLDFDPRVIEEHESQQPSCLPISYILRVFADNCRKESLNGGHNHMRKGIRSHSPALSLSSTTPTGSEMDEEDNGSDNDESSIDSWVNNPADDSANAILKIMSPPSSQASSGSIGFDDKDRPYVCTNGNCKKRYRNANGLKYHIRNIHRNNPMAHKCEDQTTGQSTASHKEYKCDFCSKIYKTSHGLKHHKKVHHSNIETTNSSTTTTTITTSTSCNNTNSSTKTQAQTQTSGQLPIQISVPIQTQTTQSTQTTTSSVQTNTTLIGKTPITNQTLSQAAKEGIIATFVRCRPLQSLTVSGGQSRLDALPVMLKLQTDIDNKINTELDLVTKPLGKKSSNDSNIKCPAIAAPTLQQHLLNPIIGKPAISVTKIL